MSALEIIAIVFCSLTVLSVSIYEIVKRVKGKGCSCGCEGCPASSKCKKKQK